MKQVVETTRQLVRFPTISSDPDEDSFKACGAFLAQRLQSMQMKVKRIGDSYRPVIVGWRQVDPDLPTIGFYQHYDVQPSGDISLWSTEPFSGAFDGRRVWGRGAQDNKGQLAYTLEAVQSSIEGGDLPLNLMFIIDGEEEIASPTLASMTASELPLIPDCILSFDNVMPSPNIVPLVKSCRGFAALEIVIATGSRPIHSGAYGGRAPNAARVMVDLLASIQASEPLLLEYAEEEASSFLKETGRFFSNGRPRHADYREVTCIEISHLSAGGDCFSATIPHRASAHLTLRPAPGLDADKELVNLVETLTAACPPRAHLDIKVLAGPISGFHLDPNSLLLSRISEVVQNKLRLLPQVTADGGCAPGLSILRALTGAQVLATGVGLPSDCIHAPNESIGVEQLELGYSFVSHVLGMFSDRGKQTENV